MNQELKEKQDKIEIPEKKGGYLRIIKAIVFSLEGLKQAWTDEAAFRQEIMILVILFPICWLMPLLLLTKILLMGSVILVLIVELLNSAVETAVDLVTDTHHPFAKKAKDVASAAVFLSILMMFAIWGLAFFSVFISPISGI
ncbi:MAG: diacylglycerol kinase [Proteobacteria bacterium]|nr:diacylglycerol kinase [Pseudomonadota bacterium]